ncbi:MAG: polymer-forming cytoskeletal protein [Desulfovibrionaceae bacterium]
MGLFKKDASEGTDNSHNTLNAFLGHGTEYSGRLEFVGTVRIDGAFKGEVASEGALVLGKEATFEGKIRVGTLISNGQVNGEVVATRKAVLQKHSALTGSLCTPALVVEEGANVEGTVEMGRGGAAMAGVIELRPGGRESAPALSQAENQS